MASDPEIHIQLDMFNPFYISSITAKMTRLIFISSFPETRGSICRLRWVLPTPLHLSTGELGVLI